VSEAAVIFCLECKVECCCDCNVATCVHRVIHLFPWSGIVDENHQLSETFRVPDLKTGRMVRLITQLTSKEEEMFRNMIRRMNNLCKVSYKYCCCIRLVFCLCNYGSCCYRH